MNPRRMVAAGLVAGALVAASCSSGSPVAAPPTTDGGSTSTSTSTSTAAPATTTTASGAASTDKATFLQQGNEICRQMNAAQVAFDQEPESQKAKSEDATPESVLHLFDGQADIITSGLQKLEALTPAAGDEATMADLYAKVQTFIDLARRAGAAVGGAGDEFSTLTDQMDQASTAANTVANAYGLTECGRADLSATTA